MEYRIELLVNDPIEGITEGTESNYDYAVLAIKSHGSYAWAGDFATKEEAELRANGPISNLPSRFW